jgi:hypothetical protein
MRTAISKIIVIVLLTGLTLLVFWQTTGHDFIIFDDEVYVTQNARVQEGLSWQGVSWALKTTHANFWHPLTWLSHMLDCEVFGLHPGGHHLAGLLLHLANTLVLFVVLRRMTSALWPSAFVAALFACHPLHVESVAWVSQRKDLLSTFFWILTLGAYVRYVEQPRIRRYVLVLVLFCLGLMAKPMLVTLPFVLLLLDYWPLRRLDLGQGSHHSTYPNNVRTPVLHLVLEKVPLFGLSAAACVVAYMAQVQGGAVKSSSLFPMGVRVSNALVSYVIYIEKTLWPHDLAVFYPHPGSWPLWQAAGAALLLVAVSTVVIAAVRKAPYLAFGWFWYLGTLVPVIGLVQVGDHAMADRYTYVPLIGLFIMMAWGGRDLVKHWPQYKTALVFSASALIIAAAMSSAQQLKHWQNSVSLFEHTLSVTENNHGARNNLGLALAQEGRFDEAVDQYLEALRIKPNDPRTLSNMGVALANQGKIKQALDHFKEALRINPNDAVASHNLDVARRRMRETR